MRGTTLPDGSPWGDADAVMDAASELRTYLAPADPVDHADAIFCFGSRDDRVPAQAVRLFEAGVSGLIVVTGGMPGRTGSSEAIEFAQQMCAGGIPPRAIILETRSRHTAENVLFGIASLRGAIDASSLAIVAWHLAMRRCRATIARHFPALTISCAPARHPQDDPWRVSPASIQAALGEFHRLRVYSSAGWIAPEHVPAKTRDAVEVLHGELAALQRLGEPPRSGTTLTPQSISQERA